MTGPVRCDSVTPPHLSVWWVVFDEPVCGLFAPAGDPTVPAVLMGMGIGPGGFSRRPTDRDGTEYWDIGLMERLAAEEPFMPALMRCVRMSGVHGRYRKAGTDEEFRF